jgi:hypothetical protein
VTLAKTTHQGKAEMLAKEQRRLIEQRRSPHNND